MSMKGRTIKAILNEAKKGTSADSSRIGRAEAILTQLKKDADWLQANNSPLYTKIKSDIDRKTSYSRPEVTKDSDDLCRFLATQKSADSNVWKNYVFLLECRNHKRESSATKNNKTVMKSGNQRKPSTNAGKLSTTSPSKDNQEYPVSNHQIRLSRYASQQLTQGNPNIADLVIK
ncbi:uncharacterized protein LOC134282832 [Saccostrea cucullata]|uniref:uncharacterized protein LOC134282832 n=1 Tax=Saccostrea cuccullata TaxID=36930 RepID=UPI002ED402CE